MAVAVHVAYCHGRALQGSPQNSKDMQCSRFAAHEHLETGLDSNAAPLRMSLSNLLPVRSTAESELGAVAVVQSDTREL